MKDQISNLSTGNRFYSSVSADLKKEAVKMKTMGDTMAECAERVRRESSEAFRLGRYVHEDLYGEAQETIRNLRAEVESLTAQRDALKEQNRRLGFSEDLWRERLIDAGGSVERDYEAEDAAYEAGQ